MQVVIMKWWIIKLLKTLCFCTSSLQIKQWNVHCFTPVIFKTTNKTNIEMETSSPTEIKRTSRVKKQTPITHMVQALLCLAVVRLCGQSVVNLTHIQCAPDISRSISLNNSRETPKAMGVFREILVWPSFIFQFSVLCALSCYVVPRYIDSL